jgi:hypothetical protein
MRAFIINGKGGCGKDTFVNFLTELADFEVLNISSVDEIKHIAIKHFGWDGIQKTPEWRKALSDLKDIQTRMCNGPFKYMCNIYEINNEEEGFIFFHVREPTEIAILQEELQATTVLIRRPEETSFKYGNHADDNVENFDYNIIIDNNGSLEDFEEAAKYFYSIYKDSRLW